MTGRRGYHQVDRPDHPAVDSQHLPRHVAGSLTITAVDSSHRPVKQLGDQRTVLRMGAAVFLGAHLIVAHVAYRPTAERLTGDNALVIRAARDAARRRPLVATPLT